MRQTGLSMDSTGEHRRYIRIARKLQQLAYAARYARSEDLTYWSSLASLVCEDDTMNAPKEYLEDQDRVVPNIKRQATEVSSDCLLFSPPLTYGLWDGPDVSYSDLQPTTATPASLRLDDSRDLGMVASIE